MHFPAAVTLYGQMLQVSTIERKQFYYSLGALWLQCIWFSSRHLFHLIMVGVALTRVGRHSVQNSRVTPHSKTLWGSIQKSQVPAQSQRNLSSQFCSSRLSVRLRESLRETKAWGSGGTASPVIAQSLRNCQHNPNAQLGQHKTCNTSTDFSWHFWATPGGLGQRTDMLWLPYTTTQMGRRWVVLA